MNTIGFSMNKYTTLLGQPGWRGGLFSCFRVSAYGPLLRIVIYIKIVHAKSFSRAISLYVPKGVGRILNGQLTVKQILDITPRGWGFPAELYSAGNTQPLGVISKIRSTVSCPFIYSTHSIWNFRKILRNGPLKRFRVNNFDVNYDSQQRPLSAHLQTRKYTSQPS